MASHMVKVNIIGIPVKFMQEIFLKVKNMERENGKAIKTQIIITYTMVTILTIKNTGKVYLHGQAETFTKAITKMMIDMETDK